jgi:hypothetical protein
MLSGSAKPSAGIIASAVIAILGSVASIAFGALMAASGLVAGTSAAPGPPAQPLPSAAVIAIMASLYLAFGAWGVVSAVGLLGRKNWARICFLIFGGLLAFLSFSATAGSLIAAVALPGTIPPNVPPGFVRGIAVVFVVISLICLAIAIWWLAYFNRSNVRAAFGRGAVASQPRQLPLAVSIVAWLLVAGGVINGIQMLLPYPLVLLGIVLRGWAAGLALALFAAISLSAGIGLLKKRIEAHSLAVGYFAFGVLNAVSYLVLPGSFARMQELVRETENNQALPVNAVGPFMVVGMVISIIGVSAILWFLIKARQPFIDACRATARTSG